MPHRNPIWDVVAELWFGGEVKGPHRGRAGKAVRQLKELAGTDDAAAKEVRRRAEVYKAKFPRVSCTPEAVIKHWCDLKPRMTDQTVKDSDVWVRLISEVRKASSKAPEKLRHIEAPERDEILERVARRLGAGGRAAVKLWVRMGLDQTAEGIRALNTWQSEGER